MDLIVMALGGNALLDPSGRQSFSRENSAIDRISKGIARLCRDENCRVVITHGNGSQIGDELMRNEHAKMFVPKLPLYILNAETQAQIGSALETSLMGRNIPWIGRNISMILAHVLVDADDSAFRNPSKQIGPFYTRPELAQELKLGKFDYIKVNDRYRRVVASPRPKQILEIEAIRAQSKKGILITCGGGGIPVIKDSKNLRGVDVVIDKDLTAQLLASSLGAKRMVILTNVDYVYADYKRMKKPIKEVSAKFLVNRLHLFEDGTIRPKLDACVRFIEAGGKEANIGSIFKLGMVIDGVSGTKIV